MRPCNGATSKGNFWRTVSDSSACESNRSWAPAGSLIQDHALRNSSSGSAQIRAIPLISGADLASAGCRMDASPSTFLLDSEQGAVYNTSMGHASVNRGGGDDR